MSIINDVNNALAEHRTGAAVMASWTHPMYRRGMYAYCSCGWRSETGYMTGELFREASNIESTNPPQHPDSNFGPDYHITDADREKALDEARDHAAFEILATIVQQEAVNA